MIKHLAIFKGNAAEDILTGKKTIESRFSKGRKPPFGLISVGDLVYIKPSGKEIIGEFRVKKVIFFDGLSEADFERIKQEYGSRISVDEVYWQSIKGVKYGTLIFIGDSARFITSPIRLKKTDLRGWVVLK